MKLIFGILTGMLMSGLAFAGDVTAFYNLGFSKDGQYYAFGQAAIEDGSGYAIAQVTVIDVAKNVIVANARIMGSETDETKTPLWALQQATAKAQITRFGINHKYSGTKLLTREPYDYSKMGPAIFSPFLQSEGGAVSEPAKYRLTVTPKDAGQRDDCYFTMNQMIKLTLSAESENESLNLVMQDDQKQPASRSCSSEYRVSHVIRYGDALVVALRYATTGFEGPDRRYMVVTAQVKLVDSK